MSKAFSSIKRFTEESDVLPFSSKYPGKTVGYLLLFDPEYLRWCLLNNMISLDERLKQTVLLKAREYNAARLEAERKKIQKSIPKAVGFDPLDVLFDDIPF